MRLFVSLALSLFSVFAHANLPALKTNTPPTLTVTTDGPFERIDPVVVGSRLVNMDNYESDAINTHGLYDQIFISQELKNRFSSRWFVRSFAYVSVVTGNSGDTISLFDEYNHALHKVAYSSSKEGIEITFKDK